MAAYNYVRPLNVGGSGNPNTVYNTPAGQFNSGTQMNAGGGYGMYGIGNVPPSNPNTVSPDRLGSLYERFQRMMEGQGGGQGGGGYDARRDYYSRQREAQGQYDPSGYGEGSQSYGQQQNLGRYRPPSMQGNGSGNQGEWNDAGGYNYNLPNAYGANRFGGGNEGYQQRPWQPPGGLDAMGGHGYDPRPTRTVRSAWSRDPASEGFNPDGTPNYAPQRPVWNTSPVSPNQPLTAFDPGSSGVDPVYNKPYPYGVKPAIKPGEYRPPGTMPPGYIDPIYGGGDTSRETSGEYGHRSMGRGGGRYVRPTPSRGLNGIPWNNGR